MSGDHNMNWYDDGTVFEGVRSKDSTVPTYHTDTAEDLRRGYMSTPRYMVSVTGSSAPSHIHTDWQTAKEEAERLSRLSQNRDRTIHIVEIKATLKPVTTHVWG